jgi:hypothetical protein
MMSRRHVNRVILIGEVAQDPEPGTLGDGTPIVTLVLATGDHRHRGRILAERLAKVARDYVCRGALLYLCGAVGENIRHKRHALRKAMKNVIPLKPPLDCAKLAERLREILLGDPSDAERVAFERALFGLRASQRAMIAARAPSPTTRSRQNRESFRRPRGG